MRLGQHHLNANGDGDMARAGRHWVRSVHHQIEQRVLKVPAPDVDQGWSAGMVEIRNDTQRCR